MHRLALASALLISAAVPAAAAAAPAALPPVKRTLTASKTTAAICHSRTGKSRGVARMSYRAPMSGFVTVRGNGATGGNWDLAVLDARSKRAMTASEGFGSGEVAQTWVGAGQRLVIQGCRKSGRDSTFPIAVTFVDAKPPTAAKPSLVRVKTTDDGILNRLESVGFDVTHNTQKGHADVIAPTAGALSILKKSGLNYEVRSSDLRKDYLRARVADARFTKRVGTSSIPSGRTTYRSYPDYQNELVGLVKDNPGLVRPVRFGKSFQGRNIEGVEIANNVGARDDGRPTYLVVALHHAREWPSAEIAMEFAHMLVDGQNSGDAQITDLLKKERVVIVPIINPDGFVASRGTDPDPADTLLANGLGTEENYDKVLDAIGQGRPLGFAPFDWDTVEGVFVPFGGNLAYRRKNCDTAIGGQRMPGDEAEQNLPCYYKVGVDPNRNYGYNWGGPGGSTDPTTQSYRGIGQWSEPETQAVWHWSQAHNVSMLITLHNVAALVLRPPGVHTEGLAPDEERMKAIGKQMADATGYTNQYGWELYDTTGTTEDWTYGGQGSFGYTIEIGPEDGKFHMPYETGVVKEWDGWGGREGHGMREALLVAAGSAANPADHAVVAGQATPGATLKLSKKFETMSAPLCTWAQGNFTSGSIISPLDCVQPGDRVGTPDNVEYTTQVPASGAYEWHVPPSTRPFVAKKVTPGTMSDTPYDTTTWNAEAGDVRPDRGVEDPNNEGDEATYSAEREFSVTEEGTKLVVDLSWGIPVQDFDLKLYRRDGGALVPAGEGTALPSTGSDGSSGNSNGVDEQITVENAAAGDYVARVIYFMTGADKDASANDWTLGLKRFRKEPDKVEAGKEYYTLSCVAPDGTVLESRDVYVDRGGVATENICVPAGGPGPGGGGTGHGGAGTGHGGGAGTPPPNPHKPPKKASRRTTCLRTANKIKGKAKRKKAVAKCRKRYPAAKPRTKRR